MYPLNLFALFPPFPRNNQVFVAMSFGDRFEPRWRDVIAPAIREVKVDGGRLVPYRVDANQVSDSVLTDILKNIAESRLVLADITTIGRLRRVPVRNGNVMYELGLAHAARLPEEVIVLRSDREVLLFDVTQIRVREYDPASDPEGARRQVKSAIVGALKEVDVQRHLAVERALQFLDRDSFMALQAASVDQLPHPVMGAHQEDGGAEQIHAIQRLLGLGLIYMARNYIPSEPPTMEKGAYSLAARYKTTPFGMAVVERWRQEAIYFIAKTRGQICER